MQEIGDFEIDQVSGGISVTRFAFLVGFVSGMGMRARERVDSMDNSMLSAMQYGA